jgi:hypothetical protein
MVLWESRVVRTQPSPEAVSQSLSLPQKRGHCLAGTQALPSSPNPQHMSPLEVSQSESVWQALGLVGAQIPPFEPSSLLPLPVLLSPQATRQPAATSHAHFIAMPPVSSSGLRG